MIIYRCQIISKKDYLELIMNKHLFPLRIAKLKWLSFRKNAAPGSLPVRISQNFFPSILTGRNL
jgi:hypothetical protein